MGELIQLPGTAREEETSLITRAPWEFRRPLWETSHFVQMRKVLAGRFEKEIAAGGEPAALSPPTPPHFVLKGAAAYTVRAMFRYREQEHRMREVYFLAGLMDCMINQVNTVLRTDLLRDIYKKVFSLKESLSVNWYGPLDHPLLPIDPEFFAEAEYRRRLGEAATLKTLYQAIRAGTDEMFDLLALEYAFYTPSLGGRQ